MMNTLTDKLAQKQLAIEGKPLGPGSHTEHEGKTMTGAQAIIASLEAEGVDTVFGYPGGQAIKIYDALYDSKKLHHVLARHEQGATHMADGYARATGKVGVVLVTSGPGATNTVTGIATAYMDSIPMVVITGQVTRGVIGTDSFQESDIVGITMPIVKHSFLLQSTDDLTETFREAFYIASTGRPGPVLIDIPSDLQGAEMVFHYPDGVNIPSYRPTYKGNAKQIKQATALIETSKRPLLYAGGGIVSSHACQELKALAEAMQIPVVTTLLGKGCFPSSHPLSLGPVGMHGSKYANMAMTECDLIISAGALFSYRVTGKLDEFSPNSKVIHIDIDPAEIGKIREANVPIVGDAQGILGGIVAQLEKSGATPVDAEWVETVNEWRERWPYYDDQFNDYPNQIVPEVALDELSKQLDPDNSIVTTEVGQHQMWAHQHIGREHARSFLRFPRCYRCQVRLPRQAGCVCCWRWIIPDEQPGNGDRGHQQHRREGVPARQSRAGHGASVAEAVLPRALFVHDSRPGARLREARRRIRLGRRAHREARRRGYSDCLRARSRICSMLPFRPTRTCIPWLRRALRLTT